jgi:O-antigen ligase
MNLHLAGAEDGFNLNAIGGTLVLIASINLVFLFSFLRRRQGQEIVSNRYVGLSLFLIFSLVICGELFFTQSIGSWLSFVISLWIILLPKKWKIRSLAAVAALLVLLVMVNKDKSLSQMESGWDILKNKIESRESQWRVGLKAVRQSPLYGIGMNRLRLKLVEGYSYSHAHNHLLHIAAELGLPALIAYLALLMGTGYMSFKIYQRAKIRWMGQAALGLSCGQLAHFLFGLGDSIPLGAKAGILFWISLGLITAIYNFALRPQEIEKCVTFSGLPTIHKPKSG